MPEYHRHKGKQVSAGKVILLLSCALLVYAGILLSIRLIGDQLEQSAIQEPVGSLESRFQSIQMEYNGDVWTYRGQELTNILIIGTDWEVDPGARSGRYAGQADFLLLITLDRHNRAITSLQLDRDTITDVRIYGPFGDYTGTRQTQLCLAYAYGTTPSQNCSNTIWSVSDLLCNVPIDVYMTLDISGIAALNDALGGITVTLEEDFSQYDPEMTAGTELTLQGKQAEYYARGRMHIGDGSNTSRMRRQQSFMLAVQEKLISGMNSDINYLSRVLDEMTGHLTMSRDRSWLISKAYECRNYSLDSGIQTLTGIHCDGADGYVEFHPDETALSEFVTAHYFKKS